MITKVQASKSKISKGLHYTCDKAIMNDTYNMESFYNAPIKEKIKEFDEFLKEDYKSKTSRKYYSYKISPNPNEYINDPNRLRLYAREFLDKYFSNCMASISIHNDKKNRLDCHILISARTLDDYKLSINNKEYDNMKTYLQDTLARKYGYEPTTREQRKYNHQRKTHSEYGIEKKGKISQIQYIKNSINEINKKYPSDQIVSEEIFKKELKKYGIELGSFKDKDGITQPTYKTKELKYPISTNKLGITYQRRRVISFFDREDKKPQPIKEQPKPQVIKEQPKTESVEMIKAKSELYATLEKYKDRLTPQHKQKIKEYISRPNLTPKNIFDLINLIIEWFKEVGRANNEYTR